MTDHLLGLHGGGRIKLVAGILRLGDIRDVPKLILVVGCFNKDGISNLPVLVTELSVTDVSL